MFQRRTRAPFPAGVILFMVLLLALIIYYWVTNRSAPLVTDPAPTTEMPDTTRNDTLQ